MTTAALVFPHQLFEQSPLLAVDGPWWLVEEQLFFREYPFHRQKLQFHRASMRYYREFAMARGKAVFYVEAADANADVRQLIPALQGRGVTCLHYCDPSDDWLHRRLQAAAAASAMALVCHPSPSFMTPDAELRGFFGKPARRYLQQRFYIGQRSSRRLLLDAEGKPLGGAWSLDAENRKRYPARRQPPPVTLPASTVYHDEAQRYVRRHFARSPGSEAGSLRYPVTHAQAQAWLADFLEQRFAGFGPFEDAILASHDVLHHGVLTPALNVGLLTPQQVLDAALAFAAERPIAASSVEGFVRQLLGWREFIHGMYRFHGRTQRTANHWQYQHDLPAAFHSASTGLPPVDMTITKVLRNAWCHHIERLMVLGNFMLLCEIHPHAVYTWFMTYFVDAYDWVMVPNVYGMSQFADGGMMASKPYFSGSHYLRRMSDYPGGEWCEIWDGLFWRFVLKQGDRLAGNPRLSMLRNSLCTMERGKRERLLARADAYLARLHASR